MSTMKNSYIRFLNCVEAFETRNNAEALDATQTQLLDMVMIAHSKDREVLVGDLLALGNIGSQATLHGRVKSLVKAGYITLLTDSVDGRKKKVVPTKLAIKRYEELSKLLLNSIAK